MMNSLALNTDGDLDISGNTLKFINGIYYVAQSVKIRLRFFLGEWFLNVNLGVPYYQQILVKNPNRIAVINYLKRAILLTSGIKSLKTFDVDFSVGSSRELKVVFEAITSYGRLEFNEIFTVI